MTILKKLTVLEQEADAYGFRWGHADQIMEQIQSEYLEVSAHLKNINGDTRDQLQEEIGDLLHAVFSLCVFCQFNPEETLQKSINKFERRFRTVKLLAESQGLTTLKGQSFEKLMKFWNQAKQTVG